MAYLDALQPLKFGGISLPYQRIQIRGSHRKASHEFPHVPGGAQEKQGRKLYEITVSTTLDERIGGFGGRYNGRNLLNDLGALVEFFENGDTLPLYVPNIGEFQAMCTNWDRTLDVQLRSGEQVELRFEEDLGEGWLVLTRLKLQGRIVANASYAVDTLLPVPAPSIFATIRAAVNSILAFRDTAMMWAGFVEAKILGLQALFIEAIDTVELFNDPENWELLEAVKALWESVNDFAETALGIDSFRSYTTPQEMSAGEVSQAIYGDTAHATDIMNFNAIGDPYSIPAGTRLRYLPDG